VIKGPQTRAVPPCGFFKSCQPVFPPLEAPRSLIRGNPFFQFPGSENFCTANEVQLARYVFDGAKPRLSDSYVSYISMKLEISGLRAGRLLMTGAIPSRGDHHEASPRICWPPACSGDEGGQKSGSSGILVEFLN